MHFLHIPPVLANCRQSYVGKFRSLWWEELLNVQIRCIICRVTVHVGVAFEVFEPSCLPLYTINHERNGGWEWFNQIPRMSDFLLFSVFCYAVSFVHKEAGAAKKKWRLSVGNSECYWQKKLSGENQTWYRMDEGEWEESGILQVMISCEIWQKTVQVGAVLRFALHGMCTEFSAAIVVGCSFQVKPHHKWDTEE